MQQATPPRDAVCRTNAAREPQALPDGVELRPLIAHPDDRGRVAEIFRVEWATGIAPVQWVVTFTDAGVMRGVHVHPRHDDYFVLLQGRIALGLHDLRPRSPTGGCAAMVELRGDEPTAVLIPHGVGHGFLFLSRSTYVVGTSHYYDPADELGCHWLDPDLGLAWPAAAAQLSARDAALPSLREVAKRIPAWQGR